MSFSQKAFGLSLADGHPSHPRVQMLQGNQGPGRPFAASFAVCCVRCLMTLVGHGKPTAWRGGLLCHFHKKQRCLPGWVRIWRVGLPMCCLFGGFRRQYGNTCKAEKSLYSTTRPPPLRRSLEQCFSKCGPWASNGSSSSIWELVKRVDRIAAPNCLT